MSQELATKTETGVSNFLSSLGGDLSGMMQVRSNLIKHPKIKLANALSDSFKKGIAKLGEFASTEMGKNFGNSLTIIPLLIKESSSLLDKDTSNITCSSRDLIKNMNGVPCMRCPHGQYWNDWSKLNSQGKAIPPGCKLSIDMMVLVYDLETGKILQTPMQMNFRKSNHKAGKEIINKVAYHPSRIPFMQRFTLSSIEGQSGPHDFFMIDAKKVKNSDVKQSELEDLAPVIKHILQLHKNDSLDLSDDEIDEKSSVQSDPSDDMPL